VKAVVSKIFWGLNSQIPPSLFPPASPITTHKEKLTELGFHNMRMIAL